LDSSPFIAYTKPEWSGLSTTPQNVLLSPASLTDLEDRLLLVRRLPHCDWCVLEFRERQALLSTLKIVREFLACKPQKGSAST
jgi:hypothetical protein